MKANSVFRELSLQKLCKNPKMTPNINKNIMLSRPLWDPSPSTFVVTEAVKMNALRRVRLSDFVIIAFEMAIRTGTVTKKAVDMFESVYVRGAEVRHLRKQDRSLHEGSPALAPDGTVMKHDGVAYPGSSVIEAGEWTTNTVWKCRGYYDWLADLLKTTDDLTASERLHLNSPYPRANALDNAIGQSYYDDLKVWLDIHGTPIVRDESTESDQHSETSSAMYYASLEEDVMSISEHGSLPDTNTMTMSPVRKVDNYRDVGPVLSEGSLHHVDELTPLTAAQMHSLELLKGKKELRKEISRLRHDNEKLNSRLHLLLRATVAALDMNEAERKQWSELLFQEDEEA